MKINFPKLIISIVLCEAAGIIGSFFTVSSISGWYSTLVKPSFNPPNWVFGPVWTTLYILMGVSLYLIWQKGLKSKKVQFAMAIFAVQLVLNSLWSIVFFGLHSPAGAFLVIVLLWVSILITLVKFYKISPLAGRLLVPYLAWVSFASLLNYSIWSLN